MSALIPRDTVTEIVAHRDAALAAYDRYFGAIEAAQAHLKDARAAVAAACAGDFSLPYAEKHRGEIEAFKQATELPNQYDLRSLARRLTDVAVWGSVVKRTDLEALMDRTAKDELREQMAFVAEKVDPSTGRLINGEEIAKHLPEATEENIVATLEGFRSRAGETWRRGVAVAFSTLDRRFRSHDGFRVGSRIILDRAFDEHGCWSYYRKQRDTLLDIERVFLVLDGKKPTAAYAGIVGMIEEQRRGGGLQARQTEHEGDYFSVRVFKNGNAHLWFRRSDLVEKVNKILADHYSIGWRDGDREDPEAPFARAVERAPAKNFGLFVTPSELADLVVGEANLYSKEPLSILEPSAGTGQLASRCAVPHLNVAPYNRDRYAKRHHVTCIEIQPELAASLRQSGGYDAVQCRDFLEVSPTIGYDRVVMNPPFDRGRDIDHVHHALRFLRPGGRLVAIMSASTEFAQTKKAQAFRDEISRLGGRFRDLPAGSFKEAGTYVNTVLLTVNAPAVSP